MTEIGLRKIEMNTTYIHQHVNKWCLLLIQCLMSWLMMMKASKKKWC